jgi:hypothetical protein
MRSCPNKMRSAAPLGNVMLNNHGVTPMALSRLLTDSNVGVLSTVVGMVVARMEAPSERKKDARSTACLAGIGHFGWIRERNSRRNLARFGRICAGMRCGASGDPKAGLLVSFSIVSSFYQGQITPSITE